MTSGGTGGEMMRGGDTGGSAELGGTGGRMRMEGTGGAGEAGASGGANPPECPAVQPAAMTACTVGRRTDCTYGMLTCNCREMAWACE
jgi:hypothetical protein